MKKNPYTDTSFKKRQDRCLTLFYADGGYYFIFFTDKAFFEWSFDRHHNILSWYIHPLFILPIFLSAYKKSFVLIAALFLPSLPAYSGFQN